MASRGAENAANAAAAQGGAGSGSLYVGDLVDDVTEAVLFETFKEVGAIISIRVCRDAVTRKTLGYAYVNFQSPLDAERALNSLNYREVRGRPVRLMWSQRDPGLRKSGAGNIFIKNLHKAIDNKALCDTFSAFGNILSSKVVTDKEGNSRGFGFVHFETEAAAQEAIERVNGMLLNEMKVFVGPFVKRMTRSAAANSKFTNLYVKELIETADADLLREKFGEFGEVTSTCTKKHPSLQRVYGFVNYAEHDQAVKAIDEWHDKEIEGVAAAGRKLYVQRAMKRGEREEEMRKKLRAERAKKQFPPGNNLYVKNLADSLTSADLRSLFAQYGTVKSAAIMKDRETGLTRGFGFVCFEEAAAAQKALSEMNGRMIDSKPLYVNTAQRKEVRRSMLELQYAQRQGSGRPPFAMGGQFAPQAQPYGFGGDNFGGYGYPMRAGMRPPGSGMWGSRGMSQPGMRRMVPSRGGASSGGGWQQQRMPPGMMSGQPPMARGMGMMGFPMPGMMPSMPPPQMRRAPEPAAQADTLTAENLAAMSPEQQKNALGEQLYHKICQTRPDQAAKITGMLLEMDVSETLNLLESPDLLNSKITEALAVLHAHEEAAAR
eukprot:Hpha_TRINITY_DN15334_c2_g1::TRINITY_DN15334_c2_g1_i1::g.90723::m.90723/K13126/PABPC; polyadenylate-binding protein